MEAYRRRVEDLLSEEGVRIEQKDGMSEVFETFKKSMRVTTEEVVGYKVCGRGKVGSA